MNRFIQPTPSFLLSRSLWGDCPSCPDRQIRVSHTQQKRKGAGIVYPFPPETGTRCGASSLGSSPGHAGHDLFPVPQKQQDQGNGDHHDRGHHRRDVRAAKAAFPDFLDPVGDQVVPRVSVIRDGQMYRFQHSITFRIVIVTTVGRQIGTMTFHR